MPLSGDIFDIQRFSIHDGPGIRTTVFLKGCPLRCPWCHNPESWLSEPQILFHRARCIACGRCAEACPVDGAIVREAERRIDRDLCTRCGRCVEACVAEALVLCGRRMTVAEVLAEVERDRPFYETSGGGMTVSGGEPLMQPEFTTALLSAAREAGLHTALDTCGLAPAGAFAGGVEHADLVLFDLKLVDPGRHRETVGGDNARILANLRSMDGRGVPVVLRVPVVPGYTDDEENIAAIARLAAELDCVRRVDLMRFHRLGTGKWDQLGLPAPMPPPEPPNDEQMARLREIVQAAGREAAVCG